MLQLGVSRVIHASWLLALGRGSDTDSASLKPEDSFLPLDSSFYNPTLIPCKLFVFRFYQLLWFEFYLHFEFLEIFLSLLLKLALCWNNLMLHCTQHFYWFVLGVSGVDSHSGSAQSAIVTGHQLLWIFLLSWEPPVTRKETRDVNLFLNFKVCYQWKVWGAQFPFLKEGLKKKTKPCVFYATYVVACICHTERVCVKVTNVTAIWSNPMVPSSYSVQVTTPFFLIPFLCNTSRILLYTAPEGWLPLGSLLWVPSGPWPQLPVVSPNSNGFSTPSAVMTVHHLLLDWEILLTGLFLFQLILPLSWLHLTESEHKWIL